MSILRLYMVPVTGNQLVLDVDSDDLVLSEGEFVYPQTALSITLAKTNSLAPAFKPFASTNPVDLSLTQTLQARVCWREPVDTAEFPPPIAVADPSGGECLCAITCQGTKITYATVTPIQ